MQGLIKSFDFGDAKFTVLIGDRGDMTVIDLIRKLAAMPMDARVWVRDASHGYEMALRDDLEAENEIVFLTITETAEELAAEVAIGHPAAEVAPCEYCGEPRHSMTAREAMVVIRDALMLRGIDPKVADERARNIACAFQGSTIL